MCHVGLGYVVISMTTAEWQLVPKKIRNYSIFPYSHQETTENHIESDDLCFASGERIKKEIKMILGNNKIV